MKKLIALLALIAVVFASPASAQGLIAPGHVLGNGAAVTRTPTDAALSAVMDKALCATNNDIVVRLAGLWACSAGLSLDGSGNVTGGTYNKVTLTAPATGATLTIADGKTLTANVSTTLAGTDGKALTISNSGTLGGADGWTLAIAASKTLTVSNSLALSGTDGKALVLTNGLTVTTNDGTLAFGAASKTLTVSKSLTLDGADGKALVLTDGLTVSGNDGTVSFGAASKTLTVNNSVGLSGTDGKTLTISNSGTLGGADGWTLAIAASKTLTVSNTLAFTAGADGQSFAFPSASDTVTGIAAAQTLTNKTLTAPTINGGTATALTSLGIRSTGTGAFDLTLNNTENLTAGRTLTLTLNNAARLISLSGDLTTASAFTTAGGFAMTLTTTGVTNVTMPTGGTLVNTTVTTLSSLASIGTITTGVWDGSVIGATYGGTGINNGSNTITLGGNVLTAGAFTTAGAFGLTLTATALTNSTLPSGTHTLAGLDVAQTFSALNQFTSVKLSSGLIYPTADSTTALQITKADGATPFVTFDSTNKRVGINKTPGAYDLDVNGAGNIGGRLTFATLDGASLQASPSTITDMTVNNSPNSANDYLPYYNAASNQWRRGTIGAIASSATAGVSSVNGLTGALSLAGGSGNAVSSVGTTLTVSSTSLVNAQTGTSYAIIDGDRAKLITAANAAAQSFSIAQAGAASIFQAGWFVDIQNNSTNAAGVVTITPTTSTINGASSYGIPPGRSARVVSDGTNYQVVNGTPGLTVSTACTITDQSGASLSITTNYCTYSIANNVVTVFANITYPTTANGSNAKISLPVAVPNKMNVVGSLAETGGAPAGSATPVALKNTSTAAFFSATAFTATPNSTLSTATFGFIIQYPAS